MAVVAALLVLIGPTLGTFKRTSINTHQSYDGTQHLDVLLDIGCEVRAG